MVTLIALLESVVVRLVVAAGGIATHTLIDNALGHSTAKGTAVSIAKDGAQAIEKLGEGGKELVGAASALLSFKFETDEVARAEAIAERLLP